MAVSAEDHLSAIIEHAGLIVDLMVLNGRRPSDAILQTYQAQKQFPVQFDIARIADDRHPALVVRRHAEIGDAGNQRRPLAHAHDQGGAAQVLEGLPG